MGHNERDDNCITKKLLDGTETASHSSCQIKEIENCTAEDH